MRTGRGRRLRVEVDGGRKHPSMKDGKEGPETRGASDCTDEGWGNGPKAVVIVCVFL